MTSLSAVIAGASFYRYWERGALIQIVGCIFLLSFLGNTFQYFIAVFRISGLINLVGTVYDFSYIVIVTIFFLHVTSFKYKRLMLFISGIVFLWGLVNLLFFQNEGDVTNFSKLTVSLTLIFYAILYFYRLMKDMPAIHLHQLPSFWFNSGIMIFGAGSVILLSSLDHIITQQPELMEWYWLIFHNVLFILHQLVFLVGLYFDLRKQQSTVDV